MQRLPAIGAAVAGCGLLVLLILAIIAMVTIARFDQGEPLDVLRQFKPLVRIWFYWVMIGFSVLVFGIILYLGGTSDRRLLR